MDIEKLKALARALEPLATASGGFGNQRQAAAYNDLVSRFRERVTRAVESRDRGEPIEPELTGELLLMARALPGVRRAAEAPSHQVQAPVAEE